MIISLTPNLTIVLNVDFFVKLGRLLLLGLTLGMFDSLGYLVSEGIFEKNIFYSSDELLLERVPSSSVSS